MVHFMDMRWTGPSAPEGVVASTSKQYHKWFIWNMAKPNWFHIIWSSQCKLLKTLFEQISSTGNHIWYNDLIRMIVYQNYDSSNDRTETRRGISQVHDDVIKWKHFPRYWPFVRGIRREQHVRICSDDVLVPIRRPAILNRSWSISLKYLYITRGPFH